jgi:hypothetical protein
MPTVAPAVPPSSRLPSPPPSAAGFSAVSVTRVDDDLFLDHVAPPDHPERGARLLAVRAGLSAAGDLVRTRGEASAFVHLAAADATDEQLARVHSWRACMRLPTSSNLAIWPAARGFSMQIHISHQARSQRPAEPRAPPSDW